MSVWVQLAAALGAGLAAGIMGIALIPFLEKLRLFEPEPKTKDTQHKDGQEDTAPVRRRPTMGGLLVLFGTLAGVVIGFSLFVPDLPERQYGTELRMLLLCTAHGALLAGAGIVVDSMSIRGRLIRRVWGIWQMLAVALVTTALQYIVTTTPDLLYSAYIAVIWYLMQDLDRECDGTTVTVSAALLLPLAVALMQVGTLLPALYAQAAAGAAIGSMVWVLHPAKCRLGRVGSYLLGSAVPMAAVMVWQTAGWTVPTLIAALPAVNALPLVFKKQTLLNMMEKNGTPPLHRIALLAAFAAAAGILAVIACR